MMKIIKQGNNKQGFEGVWTCNWCGCVWEMDSTDPKPAYSSDQRDGTALHAVSDVQGGRMASGSEPEQSIRQISRAV